MKCWAKLCCQHRCEMEWERGEGPWLTHVPLHIPKSRAGGNRTCCTHPKKPSSNKPVQPCSLQYLCGDGCNRFLTCAGGFGECCPKEIPLGKAEEPVWSVPCFAFDNPLTLGCASSSPRLLSALPGSRLRDGHATGVRTPASASAPNVASLGTSTAFPRPSDLI